MNRRSVTSGVLAALVSLGGCGFEPLYGRFGDSSIADDLARIKIQVIGSRSGQLLRNHLLDGLTPKGELTRPAHTLRVELLEPRPQDLGIARDDSIVRYSYSTVARFKLQDPTGRVVLESQSSSISSYEVTNSEFATVAGRTNARDRVLEEIASDMKAQLAVFFRSRRSPTS